MRGENIRQAMPKRCVCGEKTASNGILCKMCETILLRKLDSLEAEERLYLKEVYYLRP